MSAPPRLTLALPPDYRIDDLLAYHARDPEAVAERVERDASGARLDKALVWSGIPARLSLRFQSGCVHASLYLSRPSPLTLAPLEPPLRRMLGLNQPVAEFDARHRHHPALGRLIAARPGLRVAQSASPFEALSWAVTGQQISLAAALSLRRRLIRHVGIDVGEGLRCPPDAAYLAGIDETALRHCGYSRAKAATLHHAARRVLHGHIGLEAVGGPEELAALRAQWLAQPGIGPWTVDYMLLRGHAWLDASLHGDAAVRRGLGRLLGTAAPPDARATRDWLAAFAPWRALAAAHLWALAGTRLAQSGGNSPDT